MNDRLMRRNPVDANIQKRANNAACKKEEDAQ
jgi:hypothetical protein